jgi:hypothetical protein
LYALQLVLVYEDGRHMAILDQVGANTEQPVWNPLPAKMAVDIWREYLSRFRLNQLFEIPPGKDKTNFQLIVGSD